MIELIQVKEDATMIYKDFQDLKLSQLGFGAMRLPVINGKDSDIDQDAVNEMVKVAMESGINYFDTAWGYHGGNSEIAMGKALSSYDRSSFYLADKFPGYDLSNMTKVREIFEKQLEKTGAAYFDFYLFHNVCEMNIDMYLDRSYGIYDYLMEQKKNGRIKHLGFSCHGEPDILQRFLDAYGDDMEFCQLQLNYLDWTFQYGEKKVKMLSDRNIPVWVMEPLRGGKLVGLDPAFRERLDSSGRRESPQAWAFRFLQTIPETGVILSGMSDMEQLKDNINIFSEDRPLDGDEFDLLLSIADDMLGRKTIPCTGCSYCVSHCPMELDIPYLISLYNEHAFTEGGFLAPMALAALPDDKQPGSCVGCTSCEQVCPQNIKISEIMADFADRL